ncbi:MAG: CDP-archaeol synthase [Patescibacteria group bacterium]
MMTELLWFLPWCWFVNLSLNGLGYLGATYPRVRHRDRPLDGGWTLPDGHRLFGDSTTWCGLVLCVLIGSIGQAVLPIPHALVLALLVYAGHAAGSFIKRRCGLPRGAFLPFVDHGNYVLIAGIFLIAMGSLSLASFFIAWLLTLILTPVVTTIAFSLHVRPRPL